MHRLVQIQIPESVQPDLVMRESWPQNEKITAEWNDDGDGTSTSTTESMCPIDKTTDGTRVHVLKWKRAQSGQCPSQWQPPGRTVPGTEGGGAMCHEEEQMFMRLKRHDRANGAMFLFLPREREANRGDKNANW